MCRDGIRASFYFICHREDDNLPRRFYLHFSLQDEKHCKLMRTIAFRIWAKAWWKMNLPFISSFYFAFRSSRPLMGWRRNLWKLFFSSLLQLNGASRFDRMEREKSFPFIMQFLYFQLNALHHHTVHPHFHLLLHASAAAQKTASSKFVQLWKQRKWNWNYFLSIAPHLPVFALSYCLASIKLYQSISHIFLPSSRRAVFFPPSLCQKRFRCCWLFLAWEFWTSFCSTTGRRKNGSSFHINYRSFEKNEWIMRRIIFHETCVPLKMSLKPLELETIFHVFLTVQV